VIRKESLNVFDNPNAEKLVSLVKPKRVIVFGVTLDCCVYYVARGLNKIPGIKVSLLADVVKGLEVRPDQEVLDELRGMGTEITELAAIEKGLRCA
jgi:nicotinamidase-related amidase